MKVYLAGKISKNNWRESLDGYRAFSIDASDVADDINTENQNAELFETYFGELPVISKHPYIEVTGPFFLSCDHGCYHGEGTHGVGATIDKDLDHTLGYSGCSGTTFSRNEVVRICKNQIDRADMLFAYINSADCYGTLFEIGYASGTGKPVAVMFANDDLANSMWFIRECADIVYEVTFQSFSIARMDYINEATWIANKIAHKLMGRALWYVPDEDKTEEEIKFYADYCHLTPKEQYAEYLKSNWWQKIRLERLKIDGYKCVNCKADKNLQVHHTDYSKGWFHEDPRQDLITLCRKCHETDVHGIKD